MTKIETPVCKVERSKESLYSFLSDFNNFKSLMPEQVTNWESTSDECSFSVKGLSNIGMKIAERNASSNLLIINAGKTPIQFKLNVNLNEGTHSNESSVQLIFESEMNPMLKMMLEKPLSHLFNKITEKISLLDKQ
jgi:hypothetical protein